MGYEHERTFDDTTHGPSKYIPLDSPFAIQSAQLERRFRKRWIQHKSQNSSSAVGSEGVGHSKGNRFLVTKLRELTKQVAEGKGMVELLEQRIQQLEIESAPVVATATVCSSSAARVPSTLNKQLLIMGFSQEEILTIPAGVNDTEEAANFLFSK